ncbi:MAG: ATP-binding protein, partial [Planctomycetota bacterium]|nr:ATP-binding protein [Planctomycetota bacterium]
MYYSQWGLAETPFRAGTASQAFFPSPTHEEALARLQFLVDQHHRFGLLVGERGTGKSLLLSVLADECRQARVDVANLNLTAICPSEFPQLLAAQLTCVSLCSLNPQQAWQALSDRLAENHYEQRSTLVTLDDAHHADQAVLDQVLRLIHSDRSAGSQLTVVFAIDAGASEKIP